MVVLLAIDPSTRETGWAIFTKEKSLAVHDVAGWGEMSSSFQSSRDQGEKVSAHPRWKLVQTGMIVPHSRPQRVLVEDRIKAIGVELDRMVETWGPQDVACGKPSFMQLPHQQEGAEMLHRALERWAREHGLPLYPYPIREIRVAILGRANPGREELAYTVMTRWGLLGEGKSTHEWNAIAVGDYHLDRQKMRQGIEI